MTPTLLTFAIVPCLVAIASLPQARPKNIWEQQYKDRTAVDMATQFESEGRPVYRHRANIIKLLDLAPGLAVAEVGAGSGFLSRLAGRDVGPTGRVIATELDPKMVAYMNDRAKAENLPNVRAILGRVNGTGLDPASMNVVVIVNTYSFFDQPDTMMRSVAGALKPGGLLVIVDIPPSNGEGVDPQSVISTAAASGLVLVDRSSVVPSHFALRFRKK